VKLSLRRAAARTREALDAAITTALRRSTGCSYPLEPDQ